MVPQTDPLEPDATAHGPRAERALRGHPSLLRSARRLSRRSLVVFTVTTLASASLLILLWSRVLAANQSLGQVQVLSASPLIGRAAPDFTIHTWTWDGSPSQAIHLAALKGHPVLVNFWASWCDACREEEPGLVAAWHKYQAQGVVFIGVAYQDTQQAGTAFLAQYGVTFPSGPDPTGAIGISYGITGVPETVFITRAGIIASKVTGPLDDGTLARSLQALVKP